MTFAGFQPSLFLFLDELARNNNRPWFQRNKTRYENDVLAPCLAFIRAFQPELRKISPLFIADDRRIGGSLMRIYRDTRFAKDKSPYKTNVGIQFRPTLGKDVHAPGFYVHVEPNASFLGVGLWRPERASLGAIRAAIADDPTKWKRTTRGKSFRSEFALAGASLKTAPRGVDKNDPLIEDLRRTDFIGVKQLDDRQVLARSFRTDVARSFRASRAWMRFLCSAIGVPF